MVTMKRSFFITTAKRIEVFDNEGEFVASITANDDDDGIRVESLNFCVVENDRGALTIRFRRRLTLVGE